MFTYTNTDFKNGSFKITIKKPKYKDIEKDLEDLNNHQKSLVEILNTHFLTPEEQETYRSHYLQNKKEIEKLLGLIKKPPRKNKESILSNINNIEIDIISVYQQLKQTNKIEQPTDWENLTKKYFALRQQKNDLVSSLNSDYYIDEQITKNASVLYTAGKDHSYFYTKKYIDNTSFNKVIEKDYSIEIEDTTVSGDNVDIVKTEEVITKKKSKKKNDCNEGYECPEDKICNTDTGNCVSKKGSIGKKLLLTTTTSVKTKKETTNSKSKTSENKNCNEGYECPEEKICNPKTGKCVKKDGKIGKELLNKQKGGKKIILKM